MPIKQIKDSGFNLDIKNPNAVEAGFGDVEHLLPEYEILMAKIAATRAELKQELHYAISHANRTSD